MKVGDKVTRLLAGTIPMELTITRLTDDRVICGEDGWQFDRKTGAEIDDELGWGPPTPEEPGKMTGSFIKMPGIKYEVTE
jgi:hypothetical protein